MAEENIDEDELDALADEARYRETIKFLDDLNKSYKALFGSDPDKSLPVAEIQDKIRAEMLRRDRRPFKL